MNEIAVLEEKVAVLDKFPLGIFVLKSNFIVLSWNNQMEIWTGISRKDIVGKSLNAYFPHLNESKYAQRIELIFEGGPPTIFSSLLHKYLIPSPLPDGGFRIQDTAVIPVSIPGLEDFYALFTIQDVTDLTNRIRDYKSMRDQACIEAKKRKCAEEQLREYSQNLEEKVREGTSELQTTMKDLQKMQTQLFHSEKMASIGQLAAGVAHEINNPTSFISSNLSTLAGYEDDILVLLKRYKELISELLASGAKDERMRSIREKLKYIEDFEKEIDIDFILDDTPKLIKECIEGSDRIKKIVFDLKNFAHPGNQDREYIDINSNLDTTLNIVRNELKHKAKIIKDFGNLPQVPCYPQQLNQVFMNLLVNAAQAIEKEGEIRIKTRAYDDVVEVIISDTGVGIPEENLSKIYDPFFTTKEVGKGTGLGLNVSYNIINKHNGTIDVESKAGSGTTFTIRIPIK